jgi:hypothetical protein
MNVQRRLVRVAVVPTVLMFGIVRWGAAQSGSAQKIDSTWLRADPGIRTAEFQVIAGLTALNGGLNFNGFRNGELTLTVPKGWRVVLRFSNHDEMLPHSAEVIADAHPVPIQPVDPAFPQAATTRLAEGLSVDGKDDIRFTADKIGSYMIFCAVPGHGAAGMWIRFVVAATAQAPALTYSDR